MAEQRRHVSRKKKVYPFRRALVLILSVLLVTGAAIGGTAAFLHASTGGVINSFKAAGAPTPTVEESFDGTTKTNVKIALDTDGDGAYFVRAAILYSFQGADGSTLAAVPVENTDYSITMGSAWEKYGDYWYYKGTVLPGGKTSDLIVSCTSLNTQYKLVVDILAQTIQAVPTEAASSAWGYVPSAS